MGPTWIHALRAAPGTRWRFAPTWPAALQAAVLQARPALQAWLDPLQAAVLTLELLEPDRCSVSIARADDASPLGELRAAPDATGTWQVQLHLGGGAATASHAVDGIALMLGDERDVYLARRGDGATQPVSRWRHGDGGRVAISVFPGALGERLPAALRALLPTELPLGVLQPLAR
jgi:hypothetical protein